MKQYLDLMKKVLEEGTWQENRTGIRTKMIPGAMLQFDMSKGFPAITTKKLAFKSGVGELLGFLRGYTNAEDFERLGCKFWRANADETPGWVNNPNRKGPGDLGRIYSSQWTNWCGQLNQVEKLISDIKQDPTSRRLLVTAWNPLDLSFQALPSCHISLGVNINQSSQTMNLWWMQRSCDLFLGIPVNILSYATLLNLLTKITGYTPGILIGHLTDVHIYENHLDQIQEQLSRQPFDLPQLRLIGIDSTTKLEKIEPEQIELVGYECHPAIKAPMAV